MEKEPRIRYGDLLPTKVKKIFDGVYWANFMTDIVDTKEKIIELGKNRKLIADKYELKSRPAKRPNYIDKEYQLEDKDGNRIADHMEVYKNKNNQWVIIMSPYGCDLERESGAKKYQAFIDKGYTQIENIYSYDAVSFIKVFPKYKNKKMI